VGEVGVLDGGARTATVTAVAETRALELHRTALAVVLIEYPAVAAELLRVLSNRLRTADDLVEHILRDRSAGSGR
jgi:CRP-like cAMP-binding protein